ncbi:MAG: hypothetical protein NVSMB65_17280 [Chloroflexota bacterium]
MNYEAGIRRRLAVQGYADAEVRHIPIARVPDGLYCVQLRNGPPGPRGRFQGRYHEVFAWIAQLARGATVDGERTASPMAADPAHA